MNKQFHLVHAALDLRQAKEYQQAALLLKRAIQAEPEYIPAYIYLGLVYQDEGNMTEAEASFRQALMHEPENPEALQSLGMLLLSLERYPEAIANLEKHLQLQPEDETSLEVLVPLLVNEDRAQDAEAFLRAAWEKSHTNSAAVRYARFLISQEKLESACKFLEEALQVEESANLLVELALIQVIQKKYEEAIKSLDQAVVLRPGYDRALRGLAHCYTQMDQPDKALEYAEKALAIDPRHYRNWQAKGDALLVVGRYDEALITAKTGIDLIDPDNQEALPVLVVLYLQRVNAWLGKKDTDSALAELAQARKILPDEEVFYLRAVQLCMKRECLDDAINVIEEALKNNLEPDDKWLRYAFQLYIHSGNVGQALEYGKQKSEKYPYTLEILTSVGVDRYTDGHADSSRDLFELMLEQSPDDLRLRSNLSYILIGEGQLDLARKNLETVLTAQVDEEAKSIQGIALCNLGYLSMLEGKWDEARTHFLKVENNVSQTEEAILRVGFCWDKKFVPDYAPHPTRMIPLKADALANMVTISLYQNDIKQAQEYADRLRKDYPDIPIVGEILGTVYRFMGDYLHTRQALRMAREEVKDKLEQQMTDSWLSDLDEQKTS